MNSGLVVKAWAKKIYSYGACTAEALAIRWAIELDLEIFSVFLSLFNEVAYLAKKRILTENHNHNILYMTLLNP